jgi:competence protein ComEC
MTGDGRPLASHAPRARPWHIDPVLVVASSLALGAAACVAKVATFGVATLCLALWTLGKPRLRWRHVLYAALALGVGWGRGQAALAGFQAQQLRARALAPVPTRCAVAGRVLRSPVQRDGLLHFDAQLDQLDCDGRLDQKLVVRLYGAVSELGASELARGDEFTAIANLAIVTSFRNFLLPDPLPAAARQGAVLRGSLLEFERARRARGVMASIDRWRAQVRARIVATFAAPVRGMARALVLGETDLDAADDEAFRKSGLSHLLAVSGTHLVFAVLGVLRAFEALLVRWRWLATRSDVRRCAALAGLGLAPLYADFSGGSGSAWRAAFMLLAVLGVRALGRHPLPSRVVAASLAGGWLADGLVIFDPSFLLSLAATLGLLLFAGSSLALPSRSVALLSEPQPAASRRAAQRVAAAAFASVAATLPCLPILLWLSPGVSLASIAANLLAGPLGELVALPLCLTHTLLAPLPALERGVALVASGALALICEVAHLTASIDWLFVALPPPGAWHIGVLALGAGGLLALGANAWPGGRVHCAAAGTWSAPLRVAAPWVAALWVLATLLTLVAVELLTARQHAAAYVREQGRLVVTALDVGQGDATLIDLPDGRLVLIDGGGLPGSSLDLGARVLLPVLRARRRSRLDLLVLSHPHPDHFGGLLTLARELPIAEFWYGGSHEDGPTLGNDASAVEALLAELRAGGSVVRTAAELCARARASGDLAIDVFWPCPDLSPGQSTNDNSLVLRIRWRERAALFVGDAERWAEQRLMEREGGRLRAQFLKVGHHGSRSSSTRGFIALVQPEVASISAGAGNRFGHPHEETLATLNALGVMTVRLDTSGSVQWVTDGHTAGVRRFDLAQDQPWWDS